MVLGMNFEGPSNEELEEEKVRHRAAMDTLRRREEDAKRRQREAADTLKRKSIERAQRKK
jgi:hypothetical protein